MKKYSSNFLILLVCCTFNACKLEEKDSNATVISLRDASSKLIEVSSIFKNIDTIELNLPDNKPLGEILKIKAFKDQLIILYRFQDYNQNYIAVFQSNGDFLYQLVPDDSNYFKYNPLDISITDQNSFAVLEEYSNAIIFYSSTGYQVKKQQLPFSAKEFIYVPSSKELIFHKSSKARDNEAEKYFYNIIITNDQLAIKRKLFPFSISIGEREFLNTPFSLYKFDGDQILFQKVLTDTIFNITASTLDTSKSIIFDTGNKSLSAQNGQVGISSLIQEILNNDGVIVGGRLFYADHFLFFQYGTLAGPGVGIYNLLTGKLQTGIGMVSKDKTWINIPLGRSGDGSLYSYLNEYSLQYAPAEVLENDLAQLSLASGKTFLLILNNNFQ